MGAIFLEKQSRSTYLYHNPKPHHQQKKKDSIDIIVRNLSAPKIHLSNSYNLTCNAQESKLFHSSELIYSTTLTCTINKHAQPVMFLQAQDVLFNRAKQYLFFTHEVKGTYQNLTIQGNKVLYDLKNQIIRSNNPFTYHHPHFSLTAAKNSINLKTQRMHMSNGIQSQFYKTKH